MAEAQSGPNVAQLIAEHHEAVYGYAFRLTGSVQDAEDLAQQVFLVAHRKMGQLRNIDSAKGWLFAILRNRFLKDRQRRQPALAVDLSLNMDLLPATPLKTGEGGDRLQEALDQLPDVFRLAVTMFYFEECSYREIAERLNLPIGTVMSRLARAKGHLRSFLFEFEAGEDTRKRSAAGV
jgi:RNA polymerase sigma-70 factor, ECF subfamily